MSDPADLANTMDSLHLDPEVANLIATLEERATRIETEKATIEQEKATIEQEKATIEQEKATLREQVTRLETEKATTEQEKTALREQVTRLETENANFSKETKILREMGYRQRDKIGELEEQIESNEADLDAANCTTEEYRVEIDRLERHVDVDLSEKYEKLTARNEFLEAHVDVNLLEENKKHKARIAVLEAQTGAHAMDVDVEMQDAFDPRPVCRHWAAGSCRHGEKCKYGRHSANTAEATTSTAGTHNTTRDLELQSAK